MKAAFFAIAGLVMCLAFLRIPSLGSAVFLSPDETANAVAARAFANTGSMRIVDPALNQFAWLHPRSWVTQDGAMVPVGFLGISALFGIFWKLFGEWGMVLFTPLLVLSAAYPLWRFLKSQGLSAQLAGVVTWLAFPTVILYANRGLFPNLPTVCFAMWSAFLLWEQRANARVIAAGICAGLALAIRPVEAVWIVPMLAVAWRFRQERRNHQEKKYIALFVASTLLILLVAFIIAWKTYGSPFAIGYLLHDPVAPGSVVDPISTPWPFGFHPRNVWFNIKSYFGLFLGPWVFASLIGLGFSLKRKTTWPVIALGVWTGVVTLLIYGQALYQDHIGVNVPSFGNSFLRYTLPLVPFFVVAIATLVGSMKKKGIIILVALVLLGYWTAFSRGDENVARSADELSRYLTIRQQSAQTIGPEAIVLSDRSDKIFFPFYRVASPLPSAEQIKSLLSTVMLRVYLYSTTMDQKALDAWQEKGINLTPVLKAQNETLYLIRT